MVISVEIRWMRLPLSSGLSNFLLFFNNGVMLRMIPTVLKIFLYLNM